MMQEKIVEMQEAHDYLLYKVENYKSHMREAEKNYRGKFKITNKIAWRIVTEIRRNRSV